MQDILALEHGFWNAAGDPDFYQAHFADDGVIALGSGLMGKGEVVGVMTIAEPWSEHSIDEPRLIEITADVVVLAYRATARRAGDAADYHAVISSVYVRRGGAWRLAFHQQTPAGEG